MAGRWPGRGLSLEGGWERCRPEPEAKTCARGSSGRLPYLVRIGVSTRSDSWFAVGCRPTR
jgi:hypothetical protein